MGGNDGAEICELVGLFILNHLGKLFGKENIGLFRDDGLAIIKNKSARLADKTRKELHKAFEQFGLKITAESNLHVVNFLDVTFDLPPGKYKPYTLLKKISVFYSKKNWQLVLFYCKLTETVKWKRYCIFTDWYQFICKNLKTIMAYLVC